jgi:phosphatidylglycerophosphate synthase
MKPTDGIFARTNRRVSLRITRWLLPTRVTANMATLMVLACSVLAGLVMATGSFVAGALLSWVASMLDGVDGEIARAKLMASEWGHWLEMACDYAFYLAIILGCGVGLARVDGNAAWVQAGVVGAAGVVLAFVTVAGLKRRYGGMEPDGDYYLAFQHTLDVHLRNPVHRFTRRCTFLGTRAVCPYFMFAFALLGLARPMYVFMLVAAQLAWMLSLYSSRLHFSVQPPPEEPLRAVIRTPDVVAAEAVPGES